jgi:hypothetical protein
VKRALFAIVAFFVAGSILGQSSEPAKVRVTTWNLEWFPNGSAHETTPEMQAQRIEAAADVLKKLDPDILLLQEMRDYDACFGRIHPAYQMINGSLILNPELPSHAQRSSRIQPIVSIVRTDLFFLTVVCYFP